MNTTGAIGVWGLIEFSNFCSRACKCCPLNKKNDRVVRYRLSEEQILNGVGWAALAGIKTIVLHAGEDQGVPLEWLKRVLSLIKKKHGLTVIISMGLLGARLKECMGTDGADGYLVSRFIPTGDDFFLRRMEAHPQQVYVMSISMPFAPKPEAVISSRKEQLLLEFLKQIRIQYPHEHIMAPILPEKQSKEFLGESLKAGADMVLKSFTPAPFRRHNQAFPSAACIGDSLYTCEGCLEKIAQDIGKYTVSAFS